MDWLPEMVCVAAGEFGMGAAEGDGWAAADEMPFHSVYLDEFWIGKFPVTNVQYAEFLAQSGRGTIKMEKPFATRWARRWNHPAVRVSWDMAMEYCAWLSEKTGQQFGLPTEAQWEKAARGVDGRTYPWGNAEPVAGRCNIEGRFNDTTPVEKFYLLGDSPYGCVDMVGNVLEWCADWYGAEYYQVSPQRNPTGPASGTIHVTRGGSWCSPRQFARCSFRGAKPVPGDFLMGFRVVREK